MLQKEPTELLLLFRINTRHHACKIFKWLLYVPSGFMFNNHTYSQHSVLYIFYVKLGASSDYFPTQK